MATNMRENFVLTSMVCYGDKEKYLTKDGQNYEGEWDGDKLIDNKDVVITYPDGVKYIGPLIKSKYSGTGIYQLEENVSLTCNFQDNKPTGDVILIDPNGKTWHGFAESDNCLLIQEHAFYRNIGKDLGKGRCKLETSKRLSKDSVASSQKSRKPSLETSLKYKDLRDFEKTIFAKSKKTSSGVEISEWYQDYKQYYDTYAHIICKVKSAGESSLNIEERKWYMKYKDFEKKYLKILNDRKNKEVPLDDENLFELIHSQDYKLQNKPVSVFYPRNEAFEKNTDNCDSTCEC
ncbi:hypothetical protein ABEB36_009995 [Hypothenemus hampei]|uniref:Uncharacterized protein n=1 Tax=Hypothenemus hampei TaxID=57062 RepID=A0ABD1EI62_HYPHA